MVMVVILKVYSTKYLDIFDLDWFPWVQKPSPAQLTYCKLRGINQVFFSPSLLNAPHYSV